MVRWMSSAMAVGLALSLMGPAGAAAKKGAAKMTCPVCKMPLSTKKTAANPKAVKLPNGKTVYCCAQCDMSKMGKGHAKAGAKGK